MSKTIEQIREELDANIPRDAISEREGGMGKKLSYLAGWYVIDRLNQVFGQGNWCYQLKELTKTFEGEVAGKHYVSYIAQVDLNINMPEGITNGVGKYCHDMYFTDIGFGDGQDARNPGKAHELAVKEAVTDGIKRCAKSLGMSMGLALYDKTQEFVDVETTVPVTTGSKREPAKPTAEAPVAAKLQVAVVTSIQDAPKARDATAIRGAIKSAARVLDAQRRLALADFKKNYLTPLGVDKVDALADAVAITLYEKLKVEFQELKLA